ncbi:MAG: AAA family ATPase [Sporichthyaceae bacterium]
MLPKPTDVFGRDHEWRALGDFVGAERAGASLGLVYGRRRQGKTFLLEALVEAAGGFYWSALRQSDAQNRERLAASYRTFTAAPTPIRFDTWEDALAGLLALGEGAAEPVPVVVDELPYLLDAAPSIASVLQDLLRPRGAAARRWRTRLLLCGSALSTMQGLLAGSAPLRGRASLELLVHPFDFRDAADYWGLRSQPDLALRVHALVGGTPAYRDMCGGSSPADDGEFDEWVARALLHPASAMFREGNVLLSEEIRPSDASLYFSVLGAVAAGRTRRGEIAATIGRSEGALAHPLAALTQTRLVAPLSDALRRKRTTFHIAEPVLRLHQTIVAPNESRLVRHGGPQVWAQSSATTAARIFGPHFEHLARSWCEVHASPDSLGGPPGRVGPTVLACREHGAGHEVDVVVLDPGGNRVLAIGEAKWASQPLGVEHLERLEHCRALLGHEARLLLFARAGFDRALSAHGARPDVELVDLARLYEGD